MFTNNPFESFTKALLDGAGKFSTDEAQGAAKDMMDSLRAWGDLVQSQAQAAQAATLESVEEFKSAKDPMAAVEAFKTNTQRMVALSAKHLQEATSLSVEQFSAGVDLLQQRHPMPDAFAPVAQGMKSAASAIEGKILATLHAGAGAAKKPRR